MKRIIAIGLAALTACGGGSAQTQDSSVSTATYATVEWPGWRGPLGTGIAPDANPPIEWSEQANVRWKTALPGLGHSTPVVANGVVYVTAAVPIGEPFAPLPDDAPGAHDNIRVTQAHRFLALAIDAASGEVLWTRTLREAVPHEGGHATGTYASASPVTDGEHVFAPFGSAGLFALDTAGDVVWSFDIGHMQTKHGHGEGSSPALFGETLVVNWDHEQGSFVLALDKRTGEERWRAERDEVTSWTSPVIVEHDGRAQVIVAGTNRIRAYDLEDGSVVWECAGLSHNVVATPVVSNGLVFAASSYEKQAMLAIRLDGARGDISSTDRVAWVRRRSTPYVPSPLAFDDGVYILQHYQGIVARLDPETGVQRTRSLRIDGVRDVYASPLGVASDPARLYVVDRSGLTVVLSHEADPDTPPRVLARNALDDRLSASPVAIGDALFLRGERWLYCLARP